MTLLNRIIITLISIGLLAVGFFAFGENGILNSSQTKITETSLEKVKGLNKNPTSALEDSTFTISQKNSELIVRLYKDGIASAFAHDHVVRAGDVSGKVVFKKERPELFEMLIKVPSESLVADSEKDREKYNLSSLQEDDRKEINETMKGSEQMHVEKYPMIRFSSNKLEKKGTDNYTLTGDFTLHGITNKIALPVTITTEKNAVNISGEFRFLQSDYGIEPYSTGWGAVKNKDEVLLLFDLYATKNK